MTSPVVAQPFLTPVRLRLSRLDCTRSAPAAPSSAMPSRASEPVRMSLPSLVCVASSSVTSSRACRLHRLRFSPADVPGALCQAPSTVPLGGCQAGGLRSGLRGVCASDVLRVCASVTSSGAFSLCKCASRRSSGGALPSRQGSPPPRRCDCPTVLLQTGTLLEEACGFRGNSLPVGVCVRGLGSLSDGRLACPSISRHASACRPRAPLHLPFRRARDLWCGWAGF